MGFTDLVWKRKPVSPSPAAAPAAPRKIEHVTFIVRNPSGRKDDYGEVGEACYFVEGGTVRLCNQDGHPTSKSKPIAEGQNAQAIASRMARDVWLKRDDGDFGRNIHYEDKGWR